MNTAPALPLSTAVATPTSTPATAPAQRHAAAPHPEAGRPWWRWPMVWLVVSGPLAVVLASLVTAWVAWLHIDPVLGGGQPGHAVAASDEVAIPAHAQANPKDSLAPAMKARNHAATPQR